MYASINDGKEGVEQNNYKGLRYNAKFNSHMLIIGSTGTGKTTYVEKILENGFLEGNELLWISSEQVSKETRLSYSEKFHNFNTISFYEINKSVDVSEFFDEIIPQIKKKYVESNRQYKTIMVFDDLLTIIDKTEKFGIFLASCRHYGVLAVNIFQGFRNTDKWDNIKANSPILVVFKLGLMSGRVITQIANIVANSTEQTISKQKNWLHRAFADTVIKSPKHQHLLVDLQAKSGFNPTMFRSNTDNMYCQECFFDKGDEMHYDKFRAIRDKGDEFQIVSIIRKNTRCSKYTPNRNNFQTKNLYSGESDSDFSDNLDNYSESSEDYEFRNQRSRKRIKKFKNSRRNSAANKRRTSVRGNNERYSRQYQSNSSDSESEFESDRSNNGNDDIRRKPSYLY